MASLTVNFPDAVAPRILAALKDYGDALHNQGSLTDAQFAKKVVANFMRNVTIAYEVKSAETSARAQARTGAETDITIT